LGRLADAADAVAAGDLAQEVPEAGSRELAHVAAAFNGMTERLQATMRELALRESLAAVGEFAASLAHEVRNPLSSVRVDLQVAREEISQAPGHELVDRALRSVERLDRTVRGALRIARSGRVERRQMDLVPVIEAAMHGAEVEFLDHGIRTTLMGAIPEHIPMHGDPAALEQALLNVLLNAAHAAREEARITVRAGVHDVAITVADDGPGIPADVRTQIFEPFFSTKEDGTGLGLPTARTIVVAHGGTIDVDDHHGGASFVIRLPIRGDRRPAP
jgi:signal transduction histidine kinase